MRRVIVGVRANVAVAAVLLLTAACQTTMSVEEAKKVTASFSGAAFVPPPRTINDITAILDQQKRDNPESVAQAKARVDQEAPKTDNPVTLAEFYYRRGLAAREVGRPTQEIDDLTKAAEWSRRAAGIGPPYEDILWELVNAEIFGGKISHAIGHLQEALAATPSNRRFASIRVHGMLARLHASAGNFEAAEAAAQQVLRLVEESKAATRFLPPGAATFFRATAAETQARLAELRGRVREAESFYRDALSELAADPVTSKSPVVEFWTARLAFVLVRQGRLLEAEKEARSALLLGLNRRGRYAVRTANHVRTLATVILAQGRYAEAETLARATIEIYAKVGAAPDSSFLAFARGQLGETLVAQGRSKDALAEFETIRRGLGGDSETFRTYFGGNPAWAVALMRTGQADKAVAILDVALERRKRLLGESARGTAEIRGLLAVAHAVRGDKPRALREFAQAVPVLLTRSQDTDDEGASRPAQDQRFGMMLTAYIGLLADVNGTPLAREAGIDAAAEAFRLADVARGQGVQRALDAGAARAAASTPALADLVRREQDAKKQVSALQSVLTDALSQPTDKQDAKALASLRSQIDTLRRARQGLLAQIEKEFPAYAELINPKPATADQVRARLRPGEAVVATYVASDRTFVWAIPQTGAIAFAASPIGEKELETAVDALRKALDPSAKTLGEIPPFALAVAHRIYQTVLEPVAPGWQKAESLLLVAHGPLAQLPFSLLPTKPAALGPETGAIFSNYRAVPWLARTHAVTVLPSVTALATLRSLPPGDPHRRPFLGFGDPFFSEQQARRAAAPATASTTLAARGVPITLRSSPKTRGVDSSQLAMLPRLPETADEIRSVALAMNADLTRDVFIGAQANEKTVKTLNLSGYRVIAFATHGLVPGDLDGLTQPALALSAPGVAQVDGDGLLTMEEILGLRLNADWVVLSACNTASGQGAGSEAISGLGRAFFYAGARALLVSNWPVETTSARALTTDLFRRQSANPRLSRAKALQETMNTLIDGPGFVDPRTNQVVFSYAHPIFWAPFALVGDGGN